MLPALSLDPGSETPLYRQLFEKLRDLIALGQLARGEKLPATRELAGALGLNRATVSAAYELLEQEGLLKGHVGRGSFVEGGEIPARIAWDQVTAAAPAEIPLALPADGISFASSRPAEELFPMDEFRASCKEVLDSADAQAILQLGPANGYGPLRHYLLEEARNAGEAREGDDVLVTSGCQQGMDLVARVLVQSGDAVAVEDPVYAGLRNIFAAAGARLIGVPVGPQGMDLQVLEGVLRRERPRLVLVTPNFQNPTGITMPLAARQALLRMAAAWGAILVENDTYGALRYEGEPVPSLKSLGSDTVFLGSFSKIAFPGLRVGWAIAPKLLIDRLAEAKKRCDLHSDQLAQAVLLRFAQSGRLAAHRRRVIAAGAKRLAAVLSACERHLPEGSRFTRPQGGMNLWVRLPDPLDAGELLPRAERAGVNYLPGRYFAVSKTDPGGLRLSFAGLPPERIRTGVALLGEVFGAELQRTRAARRSEPAPALV